MLSFKDWFIETTSLSYDEFKKFSDVAKANYHYKYKQYTNQEKLKETESKDSNK